MSKSSSSLVLIALVLGASSLGLGVYSMYNPPLRLMGPQGEPGIDGTDGINGIDGMNGVDGNNGTNGTDGINGINGTDAPGYYCNSKEDIQNAINMIGSDAGRIILNNTINLDFTLNINGNGSYIFEGLGNILNCSDCEFEIIPLNVSIAKYCKFQNIIVDYRQGDGSTLIEINEKNNNTVIFDSIIFYGSSFLNDYAIVIESENVWVLNCYFYDFRYPVHVYGAKNHIISNTMIDCYYGVYVEGNVNIIDGNIIIDCYRGISVEYGNNNIINNNNIDKPTSIGMLVMYAQNNTVSNNRIQLPYSGIIYGIEIHNGNYNFVVGNSIFDGYNGLIVYDDADYNTISSNCVLFQESYCFLVGSGCNDNTIIGNTGLYGGIQNFYDNGVNTYGNTTNNNFGL